MPRRGPEAGQLASKRGRGRLRGRSMKVTRRLITWMVTGSADAGRSSKAHPSSSMAIRGPQQEG
eukprot:7624660-Alexandrium_andersonii.AAC.1